MRISFQVCLGNAVSRALHDYSNAVDVEDRMMKEIPRYLARTVRCRDGGTRWVDRHQPNCKQAGSGYNACPDSHGIAEAEVVEHSLDKEGAD